MGDTSLLMPDGIDRLEDLPYTYQTHITNALAFLRFEELPKDEVPDREIWLERDLMKEHFKMVERVREEKYGLKSKDIRDEPIGGPASTVKRNPLLKGITH